MTDSLSVSQPQYLTLCGEYSDLYLPLIIKTEHHQSLMKSSLRTHYIYTLLTVKGNKVGLTGWEATAVKSMKAEPDNCHFTSDAGEGTLIEPGGWPWPDLGVTWVWPVVTDNCVVNTPRQGRVAPPHGPHSHSASRLSISRHERHLLAPLSAANFMMA